MDKYIVEPNGVTFDINSDVKAVLGRPEVAVIPGDATSQLGTDEHECRH